MTDAPRASRAAAAACSHSFPPPRLPLPRWSAYASHEEHLKGSITAGKLADFVMLGEDPHTVDPSTLNDIPVVRTVVGGGTTYEA